MEKYSAYRDPGTGIQPFLSPVPPNASDVLAKLSLPIRYLLATVRTAIVCIIASAYFVLVNVLCLLFVPVPPLHDLITHIFTFVLARLALFIIGLYWIPVYSVTRKRGGRHAGAKASWNPSAGDLIISNWSSWIEVLWLAARFNPIFVLPVAELDPIVEFEQNSAPITHTPGRRTGTGSANIQNATKQSAAPRVAIKGFRKVSLLRLIAFTGRVPCDENEDYLDLDEIRKTSRRPIVVFPEATTSNGRGLLRFANVFDKNIPVKGYQVFIMCVRYDPPTTLTPTMTHSIPSSILNPLSHVFAISTSLAPLPISIRLLPPSESPSSQLFIASEFVTGAPGEDQLAEASASLVAQIGKFKRTTMGWEDKARFLEYRNRKK